MIKPLWPEMVISVEEVETVRDFSLPSEVSLLSENFAFRVKNDY